MDEDDLPTPRPLSRWDVVAVLAGTAHYLAQGAHDLALGALAWHDEKRTMARQVSQDLEGLG